MALSFFIMLLPSAIRAERLLGGDYQLGEQAGDGKETGYDKLPVATQAAWPTTWSPAFNSDGRGLQPTFRRASRISSFAGR
jgi:hypothetical protein